MNRFTLGCFVLCVAAFCAAEDSAPVVLDSIASSSADLYLFHSGDGGGGDVSVYQNGKARQEKVSVTAALTAVTLDRLNGPSLVEIKNASEPAAIVSGTLLLDGEYRDYTLAPGQSAVLKTKQVISWTPKVKAPTNASKFRDTFGIGEYVTLKTTVAANWSFTGDGELTGKMTNSKTVMYRAPAKPGTATIRAAFTDGSGRVAQPPPFTTIAPNGLLFHYVKPAKGLPSDEFGVGMLCDITVAPTTVSFSQTTILEFDIAAAARTGFFATVNANSSIFTTHNPPLLPTSINAKNIYGDTCAVHFPLTDAMRATLTDGSFTFNIPVAYARLGDIGVIDQSDVFTTVAQTFTIDPAGTMIVTKGGAKSAPRAAPPPGK